MPQNTPRGYTYPLYTDPMNPAGDLQALATTIDTDMDTLWDRLTAGLNQPACRVRASGVNQAIAVSTDVTATYDTELYDNAGMVNLGVSNTTINIVQTGLYVAIGRASFLSNGNATINARQLALVSSGSLGTVGRRCQEGSINQTTGVTLTTLFWAAGGTTFTMVQRQNSGATLNTSTRQLMVARMGTL
jgi:hypothetical protein